VIQISILPLNFANWGFSLFRTKFLDANFPTIKKFSDRFPTAQNVGGGGNSLHRRRCLQQAQRHNDKCAFRRPSGQGIAKKYSALYYELLLRHAFTHYWTFIRLSMSSAFFLVFFSNYLMSNIQTCKQARATLLSIRPSCCL